MPSKWLRQMGVSHCTGVATATPSPHSEQAFGERRPGFLYFVRAPYPSGDGPSRKWTRQDIGFLPRALAGVTVSIGTAALNLYQ
jgi:hypothetical protein